MEVAVDISVGRNKRWKLPKLYSAVLQLIAVSAIRRLLFTGFVPGAVQDIHSHFISERFFTGEKILPLLDIGIQHQQDGFRIIAFADECRDGIELQDLADILSPMPGNDLIPVSDLTDDDRLQDTVFGDACESLFLNPLRNNPFMLISQGLLMV